MDLFALCSELIHADSEDRVISILKRHNLWEDGSNWKSLGDLENNFSIIGNQQSKPEAALVEKIVNSIDAMLMRDCLRQKIDPESEKAPQDMQSAAEEFFGIENAKLVNLSTIRRKELAENITLISSGFRDKPCFTLVDKGEGQLPSDFPDTFLSLARSNKIKIPFVQGKFNSGGTGSLQFCGRNGLQLIVSKRDPEILDRDSKEVPWGFTMVRRFPPKSGYKNSEYKYLAIDNEIPSFVAEKLKVLPGSYPSVYEKPISSGTIIKMYDYNIRYTRRRERRWQSSRRRPGL